ncbi:MAG: hypothetical protein R6W88_01315 [Desulfobacterales bacterium]
MSHIKTVLTPKDVTEDYPALTDSEGTLANWRAQKRGPKYYKVSRKIIYRREDIEDFLFQNPVLTSDSAEGCKCQCER